MHEGARRAQKKTMRACARGVHVSVQQGEQGIAAAAISYKIVSELII
jgi:hypothetical protein